MLSTTFCVHSGTRTLSWLGRAPISSPTSAQYNRFDSQLWLTCHSASLLDDLNREEIVICEKDRDGRSRFYSLMDVQIKVRRDDNHYKKYLGGAYGGLPLIG